MRRDYEHAVCSRSVGNYLRTKYLLTVVCECHARTHRICCDDDEIRKVTNSFDEGSRLLELSLDH